MPAGTLAARPAPDAVVLAYLPFVGLVVGGLAGGLAYAASFAFGHTIAIAVAFGASIVLTGAIHVDGFMDSCDALFASVSFERRFMILKDPRHGTFAVAFFAVAAALWLAALYGVRDALLPAATAFAAGAARAASLMNAYVVPYARADAVTPAFRARPPMPVVVASFAVLAALSFAISPWTWLLLFAAPIVALVAGARLKRRLGGGLVGDVYGYLIVCGEVALLLGIVGMERLG